MCAILYVQKLCVQGLCVVVISLPVPGNHPKVSIEPDSLEVKLAVPLENQG